MILRTERCERKTIVGLNERTVVPSSKRLTGSRSIHLRKRRTRVVAAGARRVRVVVQEERS